MSVSKKVEGRLDNMGNIQFYVKGTNSLHRDDGPAYIEDEAEHWFRYNKRHRTDGPAIVYDYGVEFWFINGKIANSTEEYLELSGFSASYVSNLEDIYGKICNITEFERPDGTRLWFKDGLLHRDGGPAQIDADGTEYWYQNGKLHRTDGPAFIIKDGYQGWFFNGDYHRNGDEPAIIHADGSLEWWVHGKCHRENGPAYYDAEEGVYNWYIDNDLVYSREQFKQLTGKSDEEMSFLILRYGDIEV